MSADLAAPTGAGGRAAPGEARAAVAAPPDRAGALRRVAVGLVLLFFLFPIVYLALVSVKPQPEMLSGRLLPSRFAWENWSGAYAAAPVLLYLRNSVVVAVLSAGLTMLLAVPATYAMVRHGTGGKALSTLLLSTYMAPPVVAVLSLFYLLKRMGLIDTLPVGIALFQGDRLVRFGQMAAASLTGMVPVYAVALIFQRWMIEGLTSGAVK